MYREIIHTGGDLTALKAEITAFRAKITARKLKNLGITDLQLTDVMNEEVYVHIDSKGL